MLPCGWGPRLFRRRPGATLGETSRPVPKGRAFEGPPAWFPEAWDSMTSWCYCDFPSPPRFANWSPTVPESGRGRRHKAASSPGWRANSGLGKRGDFGVFSACGPRRRLGGFALRRVKLRLVSLRFSSFAAALRLRGDRFSSESERA